MKKRLIHRFIDEMFPSRLERALSPIETRIRSKASTVETEVIKNTYQGLPYSISRMIFRHATPNQSVYESHLEGIILPVYRNFTINHMVCRITNDLIYSACGIGISNPESPTIVVSIDNVPTDDPESFEIFYDVQKKQQSPRIRGKEEEGVTELTAKTQKVYDFFTKHRKGFQEAIDVIDREYPYRSEEWSMIIDQIVDKCGFDFIRLQQRPRICITTPQRMKEIMQRAYGPYLSAK